MRAALDLRASWIFLGMLCTVHVPEAFHLQIFIKFIKTLDIFYRKCMLPPHGGQRKHRIIGPAWVASFIEHGQGKQY
jgi:hypothetical protein